ncbi:MAG: hypothetical protein FJ100_19280 [Deltaproteobacteria bacterium]|nr:hypothetical protein [Deltaproteobacteria bacterium]
MPLPAPALQTSRLLAVAVVAAAVLSSCRDSPELVLQNARDALADLGKVACSNQDQLPEAIENLAQYVEPRAAGLLRTAPAVEKKSTGQFTVFATCKPPPNVLPDGDVVRVELGEKRSVVRLKKRKGKGEVEVPMVLVDGHWKLDLLEMPTFGAAIQLH